MGIRRIKFKSHYGSFWPVEMKELAMIGKTEANCGMHLLSWLGVLWLLNFTQQAQFRGQRLCSNPTKVIIPPQRKCRPQHHGVRNVILPGRNLLWWNILIRVVVVMIYDDGRLLGTIKTILTVADCVCCLFAKIHSVASFYYCQKLQGERSQW